MALFTPLPGRSSPIERLVAAGRLRPAQRQPFCLADDLLEPLRPLVDARVQKLLGDGFPKEGSLDQPTKAALLELLTTTVQVGDTIGPLMVGLHRTAASLVRCYRGEDKKLSIPVAAEEIMEMEGAKFDDDVP